MFRNAVKKIQLSLNSGKNNDTLHEDQNTFLIISRSFLIRMRNISTKFVEKIKTRFVFSKFCFRKSCHLWNNVEKYSRAGEARDENIVHEHFALIT